MAEALTQYKLIVLYMLDHVDFPLTNTQISNFVLENEFTGEKTVNPSYSYQNLDYVNFHSEGLTK